MSDYKINETDIDSVIKYLKTHDPKNATPEKAIALLEELQEGFHMLSHSNPELLEKMLNDLKSDNNS